MPGIPGFLRSLAVDADLLRRRRELRLLLSGQGVSLLGSELTFVALPVQMFDLTDSTLAVGLLGVAEFVPILLLALVGGALADAFDRRRLVMLSEIGSAVVAGLLVGNALLPDPQPAALYAGSALWAMLYALRRPPLDAMVPQLVQRDELKAASALESIVYNGGSIVGPALAGVLIAVAGFATVYVIDLASFLVALAALWRMRTPPPAPGAERPSLRGVIEGFRYARARHELLGTYLVDMNAMFFAVPLALFPALAEGYGGDAVVGLLYAAPGVGAVLVSLSSGWAASVHHHGRAVALAAAGYGAAIVAFGVADALWPALLALAVAGGMDGISGIFRQTIWNETIPARLRGRLAGIEMLSWSSGPTLGNARAGAAGTLLGLRGATISGGLACIAGTALLIAALPRFWRYTPEA